jgi:hypothetical protein
MDDFEQLGVTAVAEFPPATRPARNLGQLAALVVAGVVLTAVAIFACVAVAAELAVVLNGSAGIQ